MSDLGTVKLGKQWRREVDSQTRMSLVSQQRPIDQACCTDRTVSFTDDTCSQVQVGYNKRQFLFTVMA